MSTRPKLWIDRDPEERRRIVNGTLIPRSLCDEVVEAMDLVRRNMREGATPTGITFVGEPGVGKSSLLQDYAAGHGLSQSVEDGVITRTRPVLYVELGDAISVGPAADMTLVALMGPSAPQGARARYKILPEQLRLQRVELMIFDETQHILEKGAEKTQAATRDWIKFLSKKTGIPVLLAGMKEINDIVDADDQLRQIMPLKFGLPDYGYATQEEKKAFRSFLAKFDNTLPFDHPAHLADPDRARRLHIACAGVLRPLCHILRHAAYLAIQDAAGCIRDHDLAHACVLFSVFDENPFEEWL